QAEDGIRDFHVTGVQTCALPIYVRSQPELKALFSDLSNLSAREVGDGNLNMVFIVSNPRAPTESLVIKQALPYLRVLGESYPLRSEERRVGKRVRRQLEDD